MSHTLTEDVLGLFESALLPLNNNKLVTQAENSFAGYVGRSQCAVFPFVRTAIHAILQTLDLDKGDKVLLPSITIKPILDVVLALELEPVFVDVDPVTVSFESASLREALKQKPRVAVLTYLFGLVPNLDDLVGQLKTANVFIIEDFSQCLNGTWRGQKIGTFGDVAVYSASSIKTFDTYGGGFTVLDDSELAAKLRNIQSQLAAPKRSELIAKAWMSLVRNLATQRVAFGFVTWPALRLLRVVGRADLSRFVGSRDEEPLTELPKSWFRRYTSVQARVALKQLPQTAGKDSRRVEAVAAIDAQHSYSSMPSSHPDSSPVHWQHIVYAEEPEKFVEWMAKRGIDCARTSLVNISNLPAYPFRADTPHATRLFRHGMYMPCYHQLTLKEIQRVGEALNEYPG